MRISILAAAFVFATCLLGNAAPITRHYKFNIVMANYTRLGVTKSMVTVNGQYPGPTVIAREGDRVVVKVVNHVSSNITIHWHGVRQFLSGWADGPNYITQCPIQTNNTYVYNFTFEAQRGTLWYHAHVSWLRATVHGPIIILPPHNSSYPFPKPHKEFTMVLGEWFNSDPDDIINQALQTGGAPNVSNAFTINGLPGPLYNSSANETYILQVEPGKTYLLRIINAALDDELFFAIANHTMTVVEADATYVEPFETQLLLITPGQTRNVLLKTKPISPNSKFFMLARPYSNSQGPIDNTTVAGILEYKTTSFDTRTAGILECKTASFDPRNTTFVTPSLPPINDTNAAANITSRYRRLVNAEFPANVPQNVDHYFFFTVGLGTTPCPINQTCQGPTNDTKFASSINNNSFVLPSVALLESYYFEKSEGVYTTDFPRFPANPFNYTGVVTNVSNVSNGTKVVVLPFNASVELVMQDTSISGIENHPLHLHGYNFYVVGQGFGNYDPINDPKSFNLVDPVELNTVGVPSGGWVAIRWFADNPGVWFMHCHFDVHLSWGLDMAWIVLDGQLPNQKLPPPPSDLPKC